MASCLSNSGCSHDDRHHLILARLKVSRVQAYSAQRCRTDLLAVDQSRLRIASCSRRASRPMRTFKESVWVVLPMPTLRRVPASPFAHALYVFLCVVAVVIAVAKGGREEAPPLPRPEPLDGDAELAGRL